VVVANSALIGSYAPSAFLPTQFQEDIDVATCALDEQLEQLQRHYAAACRASARARIEIELLEKRDDIPEHLLSHARRQHAAADTRCARLLCAIEGLEERLEKE
jgi:hypothetical protein